MTFGTAIAMYRRRVRVSQGRLAGLIGVPQRTISRWETGEGRPTPSEIRLIVNILEAPELLEHVTRIHCDTCTCGGKLNGKVAT